MMRWSLSAAMAATFLLTACNDGSSGSNTPASYNFVAPQVNSQRNYSQTIIDDSDNTINESFSLIVTDVNADGSYVVTQDPTSEPVVVNGTTYSIQTETINVNNQSQETMVTILQSSGGVETCTYSPHGAGPGYPLTVGTSWTSQYTVTCGTAAPIEYTQTGNVLDIESVTVPAGTYTALKLQSVETHTDASGTTITQTVTNWRDVDTLFPVQRNTTLVYSGTLPSTGYAVSAQVQLQSEM